LSIEPETQADLDKMNKGLTLFIKQGAYSCVIAAVLLSYIMVLSLVFQFDVNWLGGYLAFLVAMSNILVTILQFRSTEEDKDEE